MADQRVQTLILNQFLPYRMVNLAKRISDSFSEIYMHDFGVTVPEWRILAVLAESGQQNARDIGEITSMDKSKVSRAVKQLEDKGYLIKEKDKNDNRASYLSLSEAGKELYFNIVPRALGWEERLINALDISEYRDLMRVLEKLDQQLDTF